MAEFGNPLPGKGGVTDPCFSALDSEILKPVFDLDFMANRAYCHRIVNDAAPTATRASPGCRYWLQPADAVGNNVLRYAQNSGINHLNGLLIEGADQNVIIRNYYGVFQIGDWAATGGLAWGVGTEVDLYNGGAFDPGMAIPGTGYLYQTHALTAAKYIIEALVYIEDVDNRNGQIVTAAEMQMAAGPAGAIAALASNYEHVGGRVYLVWAVFTATAANWDIGVYVKTVIPVVTYFTLLSCYLAATAAEGGDFVRSPIPNATAAAITRALETYSHPGNNNLGTTEGTIDIEVTVQCSEAEDSGVLYLLDYWKDANNRIRIYDNIATNKLRFSVLMGGVANSAAEAPTGRVRLDNLKVRLVYRQATTLDGTNYVIMYYSINNGAWAQLCASAVQPTGALDTTGNILFAQAWDGISGHWASFIRCVRIYDYAKVGLPGDF